MVHRSRLEVIMKVLDVISWEEKPTRIMYKANVNWTTLEVVLPKLMKCRLVVMRMVGRQRRYYTTENAPELLYHYDELIRLLGGKVG